LFYKVKEREILEDLGMCGRIILKCILKKCNVNVQTVFTWLWIRTSNEIL
jgi:hypothetical protein